MSRFYLVPAVSIAVLIAFAVPAAAQANNPYATYSGYDISYPQCSSTLPSSGANFGIVGVGDGRAFTLNPCLGTEYGFAASNWKSIPPSLYINTGYSGAFKTNITPTCNTNPRGLSSSPSQNFAQAWQIGCSEADYSVLQFNQNTDPSLSKPEMWWLDIETGNSWSSSNKQLNAYTILGMSDRLKGTFTAPAPSATSSVLVGAYSDASFWGVIVGPNSQIVASGLDATWNANGSCSPFITTTTTTVPNWLSQGSLNGLDYDTACP